MICQLKKIEKENLTNDLIQQDIINGFKNDSQITTNIILIIVGIFFAFCFAFYVEILRAETALFLPCKQSISLQLRGESIGFCNFFDVHTLP